MSIIRVNQIQDTSTNVAANVSGGVVTFTNTPLGLNVPANITARDPVAASGPSAEFTGIPSTAMRITLILMGVSLNTNGQNVIVQLGTSSGFQTSGYLSNSNYGGGGSGRTDGFSIFFGSNGGNFVSGSIIIYNFGSNKYVSNHTAKYNQVNALFGGGDVTLGGTLDRLKIRPHGSASFDAGNFRLLIE
jgi:hypothetical protein